MTVFRFDSLGPETFLRGRWVGIHLYSGRKVSVPVEVPRWDKVHLLSDLELLVLFILVSIAATGRGHSVDGWPRWAQEVAADSGRWLNREEIVAELYYRIRGGIAIDRAMPMPVVTEDGQLQFPGNESVDVEHFVDDEGKLRKDRWLRQLQSPPS